MGSRKNEFCCIAYRKFKLLSGLEHTCTFLLSAYAVVSQILRRLALDDGQITHV